MMMRASFLLIALVSVAFAEAAELEYIEREPVAHKYYRRRGKMRYDFGPERLGYVTLNGEDILGSAALPVPVTNLFLKGKTLYEEGELVFHQAKCPEKKLYELKFECSNGRVLAFWDDAFRITENKFIARALGDAELEARYAGQLKAKGVTSLNEVIGKCEKCANLVMVAGEIPTKSGGVRKFGHVNLPNLVKDVFPAPATAYDMKKIELEKLGRGLCVFRADKAHTCVSWRYLPDDPVDSAFDVYCNGRKVNDEPIVNATHFLTGARKPGEWRIENVKLKMENGRSGAAAASEKAYFEIPLEELADGVTPDGESYTYIPDEAGVGDLDGDGEYEIVLKRAPSISKDNSQDGYTGETMLEAYRLDGKFLWRIRLGVNIRSGAHYTQLLVYDFDGDGKAEVCVKTADGTVDGTGKVIGDAKADFRGTGGRPAKRRRGKAVGTAEEDEEEFDVKGRILSGPEYLTVFRGTDGAALDTIPYEPARGEVEDWGDTYGNRCDRFLAAVAYLDGIHPSIIESRGYYAMTKIAAYDFSGGKLKKRWFFDSSVPGNEGYAGQGFHNLRIADVDFDGRDEIVFGAMVLDHDGRGLYTTGMRHGDNQHLVQARPDMRGLQEFTCHEESGDGLVLRDAATGRKIWQHRYPFDVPMCVAADFDPVNYGYEFWLGKGYPVWDVSGRTLEGVEPSGWQRYALWWKGDMLRSVYRGGSHLEHYDWTNKTWKLEALGYPKIPKTMRPRKQKQPIFTGDILGDWREEIVIASPDDKSIYVYSSPHPTEYRFHTFMLDPVYRLSVACWPICYNQSPQAGFYFGPDLKGHGIVFRGMKLE